ncbi:conjugative transposon TraM protein [Chitinophaga dinghuensis]|uniref:Conjugative transposon TraM protein n=1 Tax=Chitinophaga dinghuensis TaxID=1539050 RepID=A0A327VXQ6_9BACT|nr:conjugative transposon protein TraM [Chitinophaga dinghuensis]RAJ80123.1 conjugative transposon TraM protein [Chitinophaga dinghuensis]
MDNQQQSLSEKTLKKRKFALVLPIIVFPFATLIFWALGGGKGTAAPAVYTKDAFNYSLPAPVLPDDSKMSKLDYYEKAARDSAKWRDIARRDPYYNSTSGKDTEKNESEVMDFHTVTEAEKSRASAKSGVVESPYSSSEADDNVRRVNRKLAELDRELNKPPMPVPGKTDHAVTGSSFPDTTGISPEVAQLEKIMQTMQSGTPEDPEMTKIDGMLDKILDIQYPSRMQDRIKRRSADHKQQVYPVSSINRDNVPVSSLQPIPSGTSLHIDTVLSLRQVSNGFYSLDDGLPEADEENAVEAEVVETQTLVTGAVLKLRLVRDVYIAGRLVPKDTYVHGAVSISGERLQVEINSIRISNSILPVAISAYDMDGMAGIYVPGAIARDVSKNSADQAIQSVGLTSLDPSIGAQAASAGIETAKTLLSRKVKLIKVTVKAGYQVLLKNRQS